MRCVKIMGNGFIEQIITQNGRFIFIMIRDFAPYFNSEVLASGAIKQEWIPIAVIYIISGLSPRGTMHIQNNKNSFPPAPSNQFIKQCEPSGFSTAAHIVFIGE